MIEAGKLDQRIELQAKAYADDGQGGTGGTWQTVATVWAGVRAKTGKERVHADLLAAEGEYMITIRYREVSPAWRVVWRGRRMNIRFVEDNGPRPLHLVLHCTTGGAT